MIIFELDGILADCEHRRHFVTSPDADGDDEYYRFISPDHIIEERRKKMLFKHRVTGKFWEPDWKSFYQECDKDSPIEPTIEIVRMYIFHGRTFQIWSGRCESAREKTISWLETHVDKTREWNKVLKMRPVGDYTPDEVLKEKWLYEWMAGGGKVGIVFDDRPKVVRMWRRIGIFVFEVNQSGKEF